MNTATVKFAGAMLSVSMILIALPQLLGGSNSTVLSPAV